MSEQKAIDPSSMKPAPKTSSGLEPNVAGLLCYLVGWITGLIFFLIEKENEFVRFHALQSILLSVALIIVEIILWIIPIIGWVLVPILGIGIFILWIFMMVKAYQGKKIKLPIIGKIAENNSKPKTA
jgi:uncharacterized membrane protein